MSKLVVNIGHKDYGYSTLKDAWQLQLENYINNVSKKYEGKLIEDNIEIAKSVINGKKIDWAKYAKIASIVGVAIVALVELSGTTVSADSVFAPSGIDIEPVKRFSNDVWWTMFKAFTYIATPILGWAGYTVAFSGNNSSKRTTAKIILASLVGGLLILGGAPWASDQLQKLVMRVFHI